MIKVESITIKEFRGIRNLTLDLRGASFAICGPNGTGKSGVVDALEFALTGNVSRLSGEGRGEVSLKEHGPHVDRREKPDEARVIVKVTIPSLGKAVTIERSLKSPATLTVTPKDPAALAILRQVEAHPEIVLSRRELIRYVVATPGNRAKEVQALLHLDQLEQVRTLLQKIANQCDRQLSALEMVTNQANQSLMGATGLSVLSDEKILTAVNLQRNTLGLPPLEQIAATTMLKDDPTKAGALKHHRIPKAQALSEIKAFRAILVEIASPELQVSIDQALSGIIDLAKDGEVMAGLQLDSFYMAGIDLMHNDACPFCDNPWNLQELKKHVLQKREHLAGIAKKRAVVEARLSPFVELLNRTGNVLQSIIEYTSLIALPISTDSLGAYRMNCEAISEKLTSVMPIDETIAAVASLTKIPVSVTEQIDAIQQAVESLPEPTAEDAARDWLTIVQERIGVWRDALLKQKSAKDDAQVARQAFDVYAVTSDQELAEVYKTVERDFASLYGFTNREDESSFAAQIVPSMGKLGFDVDFYGRGFFPPGAYHSEGHQDSMGLCLYLALMRHLQAERFTFAVLDDVLMSVDAGHRREVCALLKKKFPSTQFVLTTHDPIWLRHMKTEGLIGPRSSIQFRGWSVDEGPAQWEDRDTWTEIDDHLKMNDIRGAASLLRHYLEYEAGELCHRLRAPVEFRGDAQYQLGDLLPSVITRLRKLFGIGKAAANSWNQVEELKSVTSRETSFSLLAEASKVEMWQVNAAVHYNSWATMERADFEPVVKALRDLLGAFMCGDCGLYLHVVPSRETAESLRCECGRTDINLIKK